MPDFDLNQPINWEHIQEFDGLVINLNYDLSGMKVMTIDHNLSFFYLLVLFSAQGFHGAGDNEVVNHGGGDEDDKQLGQGNGGTHDMIGLAGTHDMLRVASRG
ncbi:hypothetical protein GUJ93_ZPchr0740g38045 [Zizania palustris]|uniref:Uncharacterized protein n=1 Tax=Zizania palustris TaxID=103762 RepID=A0A8J5RBE9_ZIZPA|nr:hypothetical protein GUJ93_ZPchr0740g38045 [Zizania palustris]